MLGWSVRANRVSGNTRACSEVEGGGPKLSGLGIALLGTDGALLTDNAVTGNRPTERSPLIGGILVASSAGFGGRDPVNNVVRGNDAQRNAPADLVYDGSGHGNRFLANRCGTSVPAGTCR
jgi:hypothetical protein